MRTLILSDLHANGTALNAALEATKGRWDRVVCLGDVVGYGPDPNEVTSKIRELGAKTIRISIRWPRRRWIGRARSSPLTI